MEGEETAISHQFMVSQMSPRLSTRLQLAVLVHSDRIAKLGEEAVIQELPSLKLAQPCSWGHKAEW